MTNRFPLIVDSISQTIKELPIGDNLDLTGSGINGGTIDGTVIGGTTPAAISGTTGTFSGNLTVDTNTLFVDAASNNVGIGTSSPQKSLVVSDGGAMGIELSPDDAGQGYSRILNFDRTTSQYEPLYIEGEDLRFSTGTSVTERMRITSTGNVGIGTSSPQSDLEIQSRTTGTDAVISLTAAGTRRYQIKALTSVGALAFVDESLASERLRIDSSGQILIGCTGIFGTTGNQGVRPGSAGQLILGSNSGELYHQVPGNIYYLVSTTGGNTSDVNLKTNVATLEGALDKVCAIRGVSFEFIEEQMSDPDKGQQIGVIAQEVEAQYPEAVVTGPDGIKSVRYEKLVAPLIEAIKEQRAVIEALEARMAVLET